MIGRNKARNFRRAVCAAFLTSGAMLTTGCSNMVTTASETSAAAGSATIAGIVKGGNQPVAFATVQMFETGQRGVGSAPTLLATTTTDTSGNFQFNLMSGTGPINSSSNSYYCPTDYNSPGLLYIKSKGGNTTGNGSTSVNNSAAAFLAPVGQCNRISNATRVSVSEATTAAMVAAVGQFIDPSTENIGHDGIGLAYNSMVNQFALVANMVSPSSGLANTSVTLTNNGSGTGATATTVVATPEFAKINTVANILSSCINQTSSSGANCNTLFANAVPPADPSRTSMPSTSFPVATDTLQAALYMFINPTNGSDAHRTNLFNLVPAAGAPFNPSLVTVPTDWTLGIAYSSAGSTCDAGGNFFSNPYDLSIDTNNTVWIGNTGNGSPVVTQLSQTGQPLSCVGGYGVHSATVFDSLGNLWYSDQGSVGLTRYNPNTNTYLVYNVQGPVMALAADAGGNVFFTTSDGNTGSVYLIRNAAVSNSTNSPVIISNTVGPIPARIFPDTAGDLFVTSGASYVSELSSQTGNPSFNNYVTTKLTAPTPTYGVVVGPANRVYITSRDPGASLTVYAPNSSGGYTLQAGFPTASNTAGLTNPAGIWIDGSQNSYVANSAPETSNGKYSISAISLGGTAISGAGTANGGFQKDAIFYNAPRQPVVDSAGNLWITNDRNTSSITQVVGAAVPIYNPYAIGLRIGRFQTIP